MFADRSDRPSDLLVDSTVGTARGASQPEEPTGPAGSQKGTDGATRTSPWAPTGAQPAHICSGLFAASREWAPTFFAIGIALKLEELGTLPHLGKN